MPQPAMLFRPITQQQAAATAALPPPPSSSEDDHQTRVIPDPRVEPEGRQGRQDWLAPNRLPNPLNYTAIKEEEEEESGGVMMA